MMSTTLADHAARALDRDRDPRQRQTSLVVEFHRLGARDDPGIAQRHKTVVQVIDENALENADLGGGKPDTGCVVHRVRHVLDEASQSAVRPRLRIGGALDQGWIGMREDIHLR
jgi:hypothetical protein